MSQSHVFMHIDKEDTARYLQEMFRVLKPGGRLYIHLPFGPKMVDTRDWVDRIRYYSVDEARRMVEGSGFVEAHLEADDNKNIFILARKP